MYTVSTPRGNNEHARPRPPFGSPSTYLRNQRPLSRCEGLAWWQNGAATRADLWGHGEGLLCAGHPQGRSSAVATQPSSFLNPTRTRTCCNWTAFCKWWHSREGLVFSLLWSFTVLPNFHLNLCLREGLRISKPRSTCFSRHMQTQASV